MQIEKKIKMKKSKINRIKKQSKPKNRGVVLIRHIPHGFYEDQLKAFFSQFGLVTRTRVSRSLKTGNARGFAFVEFQVPEVAQIAAETMNNYLMFKKRLETKYIPPEEQQYDFFQTSIKQVNDDGEIVLESKGILKKQAYVDQYNADSSPDNLEKRIQRIQSNLKKLKSKFSAVGVEVDPVIMTGIIKSDESQLVSKKANKSEKSVSTEQPKQAVKDVPEPKKFTKPQLADLLKDINEASEDSSDDDFEIDLDDSKLAVDDDDSIEDEDLDEEESGDEDMDSDDIDMDVESGDEDAENEEGSDEDDDDEDDSDEEEEDSEDASAPPSPPKRKASLSDPKFKNLLAKKETHAIKKTNATRKNSVPDLKTMKKLKGLIEKNPNQVKHVKAGGQKFGKKKNN